MGRAGPQASIVVLVDTNILVDVALERQPYFRLSTDLLQRLERLPGSGFVAWHSVATCYYLVEQSLGSERARTLIETLSDFLTVAPTRHESLLYALSLQMRDFEDAMQVAAAHTAGVQHIVTRDARDFANSPIPAITPEQALQELF